MGKKAAAARGGSGSRGVISKKMPRSGDIIDVSGAKLRYLASDVVLPDTFDNLGVGDSVVYDMEVATTGIARARNVSKE